MEFREIEQLLNYKFKNINLLSNVFKYDDVLINEGNLFLNHYLNIYLLNEFLNKDDLELFYSKEIIDDVKNTLLSDDYLTKRMNKLSLSNYLEDKTKAPIFFKALVGAIILDNNDNKMIDKLLNIDEGILLNISPNENYVLLVNEWSKVKAKELPKYELNNNYNVNLTAPGLDKIFTAKSNTKLTAIIKAYMEAYSYIEENDLVLKITDIIGSPDPENAINQLQDLYVKGYINEPVYKIALKGVNNGMDIWKCRVLVEGYRESFSAEDTSKKTAKRLAAYEMIKYIVDLK